VTRVDGTVAGLVVAGGVPLAACVAGAVLARLADAGYYVDAVVAYARVCGLVLVADGTACVAGYVRHGRRGRHHDRRRGDVERALGDAPRVSDVT